MQFHVLTYVAPLTSLAVSSETCKDRSGNEDEYERSGAGEGGGTVIILVLVGIISLLGLVLPIIFEEGGLEIITSMSVKIVWGVAIVVGIVYKSPVCMILCMICNANRRQRTKKKK
ncbi:hypothetical protein OESDEN_05355 [Oesophagostomum dentatum]|uniref:Uncharacterized protein n=1 Tax=Oesophagostomum dentatum TaxID=61180 RepID=A0A0B1TBS5_OESDE|nr:hypothetical protein OESDEN_05355 [Oesophagostomum dentatum]